MYACIASPANSGKFASICVNCRRLVGADAPAAMVSTKPSKGSHPAGVTTPFTALVQLRVAPLRCCAPFCHSAGKNAPCTISRYVKHKPGRPAAVGRPSALQREPPWLENGPSTLSLGATSWFASGVTFGNAAVPLPCSSFLAIFGQLRPR